MRRVVIVQARMTSTRLPGKTLMDLAGKPMLARQLERLERCRAADAIVVACTERKEDDPIAALAKAEGVACFRGSEDDVLSRYAGAAREAKADVIGRVTADCPLIDPEVVDRVLSAVDGVDYASNVLKRTYPRGLDAEALTREALERIDELARSKPAREHVTYFLLKEKPELFKTRSVEDDEDNSDLRWTVDTADDLKMVRTVYDGLGGTFASYRDTLAYVRAHPEIAKLNAGVAQKER